jgi:hypothetical protein
MWENKATPRRSLYSCMPKDGQSVPLMSINTIDIIFVNPILWADVIRSLREGF